MEGRKRLCLAVLLTVAATSVLGQSGGRLDVRAWMGEEPMTPKRIVDELVEYFSVRDPHGIPVLKVPEPIEYPGELPASQITLYSPTISGHSGIRLEYVNVNLTSLTSTAKISLPRITIEGDYEWPGYFTNSEGFCNITMVGMEMSLDLIFDVNDEGNLAVDPKLGLVYDDLLLNFTGLVYTHSIMVGAAGTFFSSIIQPLIFDKIQGKVKTLINERLEQRLGDIYFPDSISPLDYAVAKMRMDFRGKNLEPLKITDVDYHLTWGVTVQLQNIEVHGLTTLHRTHEISAQFIDNAVYVTVQIGTQALKGSADWQLSASILPAVVGHLDLEVDGVEVTVEAQQPADIRSPPTMRKIDVKLGNVAVRSAGEGTLDYVVEAMVNLLPNFFRNQIMDEIEPRIRQVIQRRFNRLDLYRIVMNKLREREATAAA